LAGRQALPNREIRERITTRITVSDGESAGYHLLMPAGKGFQMVETVIAKLRATKTRPELEALRKATFEAMSSGGKEVFDKVQKEFIKAKNRVRW